MLFARRDEEVIMLAASGCSMLLNIVLLIMVIFYFITLMKALQACSPGNRTMEPGLVWLNLVPVLSLFWSFWTVVNVGNSLRNEFVARGMDRGGSYGKTLGISMYALNLLSFPILFVGIFLAIVIAREEGEKAAMVIMLGTGGLFGLLGVIQIALFITYWVQIAGFTRRLRESGGGYGSGRGDYDRQGYDRGGYDRGGQDRGGYDDRSGRDDRGRGEGRGDFDDDYRPRSPGTGE